MSSRPRIYLVSLGCPKNLVDSEGMTTLLENAGCTTVATPEEADLLIVNTCGFIRSAREESRTVLRELARARRPGQRLIAAGCYAQRSPHELSDDVPGMDGLIGTRRWTDIVTLIERLDERPEKGHTALPCVQLPETSPLKQAPLDLPRVAVQGTSAYLKLADGCRRSCAFCAIPLIKGTAVSRRTDDILADAVMLAERGVQEIILIAQDTTGYGHDLGLRHGLPNLLEQLVGAVPQVPWIRLMYAFPGPAVDRLIDVMARHPQILPYLDIPLQHAHPDVLSRMRRPSDVEKVRHTVERMRAMIPDVAIRTTFLVGFPGETEAEFQVLIDFVAEMAFDRVGVFAYSHEEDTPAARMADDVPQAVKEARCGQLMAVQQPISLAKNQALVGRTLDVLLEGQGDGLSVGRSYRDAPEIDGLVLVHGELPVGQIIPVRVTTALEYDLVGTPTQ
jgi:ribosomal protein S12 methylthiotransferase